MNQRILKTVYLLVWSMILGFGLLSPSVAQEEAPLPKITPLWTVTENFCLPEASCGQMWRLSADGEHLFVYIVHTTTMYVYAKGQDNVTSYKVQTYPLTTFPESFDQEFDYFPLDDHVILYPDRPSGGKLMRLDLRTGEAHIFGVQQGIKGCLNYWYAESLNPPFTAFHYLPSLHSLLICRKTRGYGSRAAVFISTLNLKSGHLTNVVDVGTGDYSYINVVGGRDGDVYLEPGAGTRREDEKHLIMHWNTSTSNWERIEIPELLLDNDDFYHPRFTGVDRQSNLYFESHFGNDRTQRLIITKLNPTTNVRQVIKGDQLGWNPYFVGLDADGQMIILNQMMLPSTNSTVNVISRYEFDAPSPSG